MESIIVDSMGNELFLGDDILFFSPSRNKLTKGFVYYNGCCSYSKSIYRLGVCVKRKNGSLAKINLYSYSGQFNSVICLDTSFKVKWGLIYEKRISQARVN